MRGNGSLSAARQSSESSPPDKEKESWIVSSLEGAAAACCYTVDTFDEGDCYQPAKAKEENTENFASIDLALGLTENHFSRPEGYFGFSTKEELEIAIESCKEMIMETQEKTDRWRKLVNKLAQLRRKYQEIKEGCQELPPGNVVLGHHLELGSLDKLQQCERCCGVICGVVHSWYHCRNCGFQCHSKCVNLITRICAYTKVTEKPEYILDICPERGLAEQKYRCAECKRKFSFSEHDCLPKLCDYNGMNYCSNCHWSSQAIIPARVVHNWDFTPRKVCQASLQFLKIMSSKPVLHIESLNSALFGFVPELKTVKKLRQDILLMKRYFMSCRAAQEEKLLLLLQQRQHFVESADTYSLRDLNDIISGALLHYLESVHSLFLNHITVMCQGCHGKGFICELCKSKEILFPFYAQTQPCPECNSLFHQKCYQRLEGQCPKCERRAKQKENLKE